MSPDASTTSCVAGRAARDPGSSRFYLSLDDPLMRIFAGERVRAIMDRLKMPEGEAIEAGMVTRSIEGAQRKVEARNFDMRKQLLEYDDVANDQRKVIYKQRNDILDASSLKAQIAGLREGSFSDLVHQHVPPGTVEEQWDLVGLERTLAQEWAIELPLVKMVEESSAVTDEDIVERVLGTANKAYDDKIAHIDHDQFMQFERGMLLQSIDTSWREHLASLDYLRQGIHLRSYAQKQPKQEYKREAFELFGQMLDSVKNEVTRILMNVRIQSPEEAAAAAEETQRRNQELARQAQGEHRELLADGSTLTEAQAAAAALPADQIPQVGRNDPCPCGSGLKYKACHGRLS